MNRIALWLWIAFWMTLWVYLNWVNAHTEKEIEYCKKVVERHQVVITAEETTAKLEQMKEDLSWLNQRLLKEFYELAKSSNYDLDRKKYNECKEWMHWCDTPDPKPQKWSDVISLIDYYIAEYWIQHSASTVHRIAKCESWYNPTAKFPRVNHDWSRYERSIQCANGICSSATWVFQFTNSTRTERSPRAWHAWASKYNAEANIETAILMMSRWMRERRECY